METNYIVGEEFANEDDDRGNFNDDGKQTLKDIQKRNIESESGVFKCKSASQNQQKILTMPKNMQKYTLKV